MVLVLASGLEMTELCSEAGILLPCLEEWTGGWGHIRLKCAFLGGWGVSLTGLMCHTLTLPFTYPLGGC